MFYILCYPSGTNQCSEVHGRTGGEEERKRVREDMECERMRVQSEAGPCCVAPRGGTEAFLLTDWRPDRLHRPHSACPAGRIAFTHICARLPFYNLRLCQLHPRSPTLLPPLTLPFTESWTLRPALPPSYAPDALISLSNTTFPDVCWLLHH